MQAFCEDEFSFLEDMLEDPIKDLSKQVLFTNFYINIYKTKNTIITNNTSFHKMTYGRSSELQGV